MGQNSSTSNNNEGRNLAGMYFGDRFTLATEEFPSVGEDAFLFGEMGDLNLINRVGGTVPRVPTDVKHTNTLRALVNVHRSSINLVKHHDGDSPLDEYHLSFTMDADSPCQVTVSYFVEELQSSNGDITFKHYKSKYKTYQSDTIEEGFNIPFADPEFVVSGLSNEADYEQHVTGTRLFFPIVIQVTALSASCKHTQLTYCTFTKSGDSFGIQLIAQKLNIDGVTYLLREIYGLDKHETQPDDENDDDHKDDDSDLDDEGDCVVCLCNPIDSLVLPCRHMCLCSVCAGSLRDQSTNCPICRKPFYAILQIQAAVKATEDELRAHEVEMKGSEEEGSRGDAVGEHTNVQVNETHSDAESEEDEVNEIEFVDGLNGFRSVPLAQALLSTKDRDLEYNDTNTAGMNRYAANNSDDETEQQQQQHVLMHDDDDDEEEEEELEQKRKKDDVVVDIEINNNSTRKKTLRRKTDNEAVTRSSTSNDNNNMVIDFSAVSSLNNEEEL
eukprot:m.91006 g.91006  ORF g.91006 m.91006 type:complete len:499 (+) comp12321_c0_seq3:78-1574(+)